MSAIKYHIPRNNSQSYLGVGKTASDFFAFLRRLEEDGREYERQQRVHKNRSGAFEDDESSTESSTEESSTDESEHDYDTIITPRTHNSPQMDSPVVHHSFSLRDLFRKLEEDGRASQRSIEKDFDRAVHVKDKENKTKKSGRSMKDENAIKDRFSLSTWLARMEKEGRKNKKKI